MGWRAKIKTKGGFSVIEALDSDEHREGGVVGWFFFSVITPLGGTDMLGSQPHLNPIARGCLFQEEVGPRPKRVLTQTDTPSNPDRGGF